MGERHGAAGVVCVAGGDVEQLPDASKCNTACVPWINHSRERRVCLQSQESRKAEAAPVSGSM